MNDGYLCKNLSSVLLSIPLKDQNSDGKNVMLFSDSECANMLLPVFVRAHTCAPSC